MFKSKDERLKPGTINGRHVFGEVNPSGKLPYSYPRFRHSFINYWHKLAEERQAQPGPYNYKSDSNPLFEFGHGLSYTTVQPNVVLSTKKFSGNQNVTVNVTVKNTGTRFGRRSSSSTHPTSTPPSRPTRSDFAASRRSHWLRVPKRW
jgi:hypothetical protein